MICDIYRSLKYVSLVKYNWSYSEILYENKREFKKKKNDFSHRT